MGIYLVIEANNGLILMWDRKTSLFIKLSPKYKVTLNKYMNECSGLNVSSRQQKTNFILNMNTFSGSCVWAVWQLWQDRKQWLHHEEPCCGGEPPGVREQLEGFTKLPQHPAHEQPLHSQPLQTGVGPETVQHHTERHLLCLPLHCTLLLKGRPCYFWFMLEASASVCRAKVTSNHQTCFLCQSRDAMRSRKTFPHSLPWGKRRP